METGPWCNICQCILYEVERILFLRFSTFQCHSGLFTENRTGPSDWCTPSSNLVDPTLVLLHLLVDYTVLLPRSHHLLIQPHNHALHPLRTDETNGPQALRKSLLQRNVSDKAAQIILKSWSAGT